MSRSDEPDADAPEPDEAPAQPASAGPAASRPTALLISIAAVVVLAVVGVVVFLMTGDGSDEDKAARPVPTIEDSDPPTGTIPSPPADGSTPPPLSTATSAAPPPPAGEAGEAQAVAEQVATAISDADMATLTQLSCDPSTAGDEDTFPADATAEVVGEPVIEGDTATIEVRLTIAGAEPTVVPMPLTKQGDRWCIP